MERTPPKPCTGILSVIALLLIALIIGNFYGLYTDRFYPLRADNYILPLVALPHFVYLYVIYFKIREEEQPDAVMRNLEFFLYLILFFYGFKAYEAFQWILEYGTLDDGVVVSPLFLPIALALFGGYLLLVALTLYSFSLRRARIGKYLREYLESPFEKWEEEEAGPGSDPHATH